MILVDTSVWVDYFNGNNNKHTDLLDTALAEGIVAIGDRENAPRQGEFPRCL